MKLNSFRSIGLAAALSLTGCGVTDADVGAPTAVNDSNEAALTGPGGAATDARVPELGNDVAVIKQAKVSLAQGLAIAAQQGPVIEAKYELDDSGNLSLSLYPTGQGLDVDAERNAFRELSGDPKVTPFNGSLEVFSDREHLLRSARDLTLVQLSSRTLRGVVQQAADDGTVFWAIPTIRYGRAGYGVYTWANGRQRYHFYDGRGSRDTTWWPEDLGTGPGSAKTDERVPELGNDLSIVKQSKISLRAAVAKIEAEKGPVIEAKFELGDDGKLSLSVYPVGKGLGTDSERNTFFEASGDPTAATWAPSYEEFDVPDAEHLTRSSRDLTIVQTASLKLSDAIEMVEDALPGGTVFWAIPTIRDTRSGYGIYVLGCDGQQHYFFIS